MNKIKTAIDPFRRANLKLVTEYRMEVRRPKVWFQPTLDDRTEVEQREAVAKRNPRNLAA